MGNRNDSEDHHIGEACGDDGALLTKTRRDHPCGKIKSQRGKAGQGGDECGESSTGPQLDGSQGNHRDHRTEPD